MNPRIFLLAFFLIAIPACNATLELGVERTPTPNHAATATISALANENARLATRVATLTSVTPIAPDLGKLAFVQGGDILVMTLPDGAPQRLTTDGRNSTPRWSPSGTWLAFRKERALMVQREVPCEAPGRLQEMCRDLVATIQKQIWLIEVAGTRSRVLNQGLTVDQFAWSPASDRLAFVTETGGLQMTTPENATVLALTTSIGGGQIGRVAWNGDGTHIAYEWRASDLAAQSLWIVAAENGERDQVYSAGATRSDIFLASWAGDGKQILFWQSETRGAPSADGLTLYRVPPQKNATPTRVATTPMAYHDFIASASNGALAVVTGVSASTWTSKTIETGKPITPKNLAAIAPTWSPNSARIAFAAMPARAELNFEDALGALMARRIWVANAAGEGEPRRLTSTASYREERPLWSADGNYILFARFDQRGRVTLWTVAVETGMTRQVVDELTPAPDPLGFFGHIEWDALLDWWRGAGK